MPLHINTFKGGLDLDTNVNAYDNTHYPYALNLRLLSDGQSTSATLTSMEESEIIFNIPSGYIVVGLANLRDSLVMFTKNGATGSIYLIPYSALTTGVNIATYLKVTKQFNFGSNVQIVARYETPNLQKIYWVDGTNVVRFANLALDSSDLGAMALDEFNIVQEVTLSTPTLDAMTSGNLKVGVVQYAYCLYNVGGSETGYSSASKPIPISLSSLNETTSLLFRGSNIGEVSNKGVRISIGSIDTTFDRIRVVRLYYAEQNSTPEVDVIYEGSLSSTMLISDSGGTSLGTITINDYRFIPNIFSARTIEAKNDYLFAGNVTESTFDVNFDARAYRFKNYNGNQYARVYNQDGSYYQMSSTLNYYPYYYNSSGVLQEIIGVAWQIPETSDCINSFNIITNTSLDDGYKFKSNLTSLGGTGKYLEYRFPAVERIVDSGNTDGSHLRVYTTANANGYQDLSNPIIINSNLGYQRDEIYRFGIVFYDVYGRQSFVKWVGDIRFPSEIDGWWFSISGNTIRDIGIEFTLNADGRALLESQGVVSWQIVRAERTYDDATVKDCGYISSLYNNSSVMRWRDLPQIASADNNTPLVLEYITPETNYNKNNYSTYNRLDIYSGHTLRGLTSKNSAGMGATCVTFKLDGTTIEETPIYKTISKSLLFKYTGDTESFTTLFPFGYSKNLSNRFGPIYSRDSTSYDPDQYNRCTKGTTLLLKIDGSAPSNGVKYVRRRSYTYPYGGSSFGSRLNTQYYPCSSALPVSTVTQTVFGGDCYIGWFEYMRGIWSTKESIINSNGARRIRNMSNQIAYLLVETKINLKYTINPTWSYYDNGVIGDYNESDLVKTGYEYNAIKETKGVYELDWDDELYFTQDFDLYTYNPVYSQMDKSKVFFPEPLDFISNNSIDTRVYRTSNKINGENSDTWTKFPINNQLDVDTQYGGLTKLLTFNNKLFFLQDKAVGILPVSEREVVTSTSGSATTIGTGGVLERYDYIATGTGCSDLNGVTNSFKALYYIDSKNKKLCRFGENLEYLSDLKGLKSYADNASYSNISTLFNPNYNELWFKVGNSNYVIFNEYTNSFTSFTDEGFMRGIWNNGNTYIVSTSATFKKLDVTSTYKNIELTLFINPDGVLTNRFDSITASSIVDRNGTVQDKSFSTVALYNQYQNKNSAAFYPPARKRMRQFIYNDMRDSNDGSRFIDSYLQVNFTFTKAFSNERFKIHDMITNYMPINAR